MIIYVCHTENVSPLGNTHTQRQYTFAATECRQEWDYSSQLWREKNIH